MTEGMGTVGLDENRLRAASELVGPHIAGKLDPDFLKYFVDVLSKNRPFHEIPLEEVRANPEKYRQPWCIDTSGYERVFNHQIASEDGITFAVRAYYPDPEKHGKGPYAVHLNFHGGGFVLGDLTTDSSLCLSMREAGVVVLDVNYRHCPESMWGKCILDARAALHWTRREAVSLNIKRDSISVGGISAGGLISIVLQHLARDADIPLKLCMTTVPCAGDWMRYKDYSESPFTSFRELHQAPVLPWARIHWFAEKCTEGRLDKWEGFATLPDWWPSPLRASNWTGLCDTFIRTAELDPLRDEGEAYASKLIEGGNKVTVKRYLGSPHTFMFMSVMKPKRDFDEDSIVALRRAHGLA